MAARHQPSRLARRLVAAAAMLVIVPIAACGGSQKAPPPPPPLRPAPIAQPSAAATPADCEPADPTRNLPAKIFQQRSIDEAKKLAAASLSKLQAAAAPDLERSAREQLLREAVDGFITALLADPYNVNATYNLAAGYARVGRRQCAMNLLTRLIQMRDHHSRKEEVEAKLDRLLGRKKTALDPDFHDMRDDQRFRALIAKMCEGSADSACVFGTAPK
jgi:hypothetical protein